MRIYFIFFNILYYLNFVFTSNSHDFVFRNKTNIKDCDLQQWYNATTIYGDENICHFNLSGVVTVRIKTIRHNVTKENKTPLILIARLYDGATTWTVPMKKNDGSEKRTPYNTVSQTLCPALTGEGHENSFFLDISTASKEEIPYSFKVFPDTDFVLDLETERYIKVNPAEPMFFRYKFTGNDERVLVKAISDSKLCAVLMVQNSRCPSADTDSARSRSHYATMTTQAAITVERERLTGDTFFVIVAVKESDFDCQFQSGKINPFQPTNQDDEDLVHSILESLKHGPHREKNVIVRVERMPNISEYFWPALFPVIFFGLFYIATIITVAISWCRMGNGGKSFFAHLLPSKVVEDIYEDPSPTVQNLVKELVEMKTNQSCGTNKDMESEIDQLENGVNEAADMIVTDSGGEQSSDKSDSELLNEYNRDEDTEDTKDLHRLKARLFITDVTRKPHKKLTKKINVYYWNLVTVSVFYALPVIQLVLTYQSVVNLSGDQDICYYNFFCARPYHKVNAFNNIYSNIGYMMLGLLFIFLVLRRDRLSKYEKSLDPERKKQYGIPDHFGLLYAMGFALFMEGVMSSCYHVCPNYSNFQFDTAFMYMIGLLGLLRLYQTRHHDVFLNGHFAYTGFAAVIFTSVIGVIFRSRVFWAIFLLLHMLLCLYVSCQIYYMGRLKSAFRLYWKISAKKSWFTAPTFKVRFILLVIFNLENWALAINGLVILPKDFATYLLGIIILNGLLYVGFYIVMKARHGEKLKCLPMFCMILSCLTWGVAVRFFIQGLTDWQTSPAESREGNQSCYIFDFYDEHDLWHFLSAIALFFSFVAVLTLDDGLETQERHTIVVF